VKRPRACQACQSARQRDNERAWHARHPGLYDQKYHRIKKAMRSQHLQKCARKITRLCEAGSRFFGEKIEIVNFERMLTLFFKDLEVRAANKFWAIEKSYLHAML
jgi:hypothetical protein